MKKLFYTFTVLALINMGCFASGNTPVDKSCDGDGSSMDEDSLIRYPNDKFSIADYVRTDGYYTNSTDTLTEFSLLFFNDHNDVAYGNYCAGKKGNKGGTNKDGFGLIGVGLGVGPVGFLIPLFSKFKPVTEQYAYIKYGKCQNLSYGLTRIKNDTIVCQIHTFETTKRRTFDLHTLLFKIVNRDTLIALGMPADTLGRDNFNVLHFHKAATRPENDVRLRGFDGLWDDADARKAWRKKNRWKTEDYWKIPDEKKGK